MQPAKTRRIIAEVISYLFIGLFIYAAVSKLQDYEKFKAQMGQSTMLTSYAGVLAWAVPGIEIGIALLLFIPRTVLAGLYAAFTLMVSFSAYIGILLAAGGHLPCSCGGILEKMSWTQHLVFNMVFVVLAGIGIWLCSPSRTEGRNLKKYSAANLNRARLKTRDPE